MGGELVSRRKSNPAPLTLEEFRREAEQDVRGAWDVNGAFSGTRTFNVVAGDGRMLVSATVAADVADDHCLLELWRLLEHYDPTPARPQLQIV